MILTSENIGFSIRRYEAEIVMVLLDYPEGLFAEEIQGRLRRMSLSISLVVNLLSRLIHYGLVKLDFEADQPHKAFYYLTANGWLKAVTLERPRSSKERMQACGA